MAATWFAKQGEEQVGPLSYEQLKKMAGGGEIQRTTMIREGALGKWMPAIQVPGLFDAPSIPRPVAPVGKAVPQPGIAIPKPGGGLRVPGAAPPPPPPPPKPIVTSAGAAASGGGFSINTGADSASSATPAGGFSINTGAEAAPAARPASGASRTAEGAAPRRGGKKQRESNPGMMYALIGGAVVVVALGAVVAVNFMRSGSDPSALAKNDAAKAAGKPGEKPAEKPGDKPAEKPADATAKATDKPADATAPKPADKAAEKIAEKPTDKPAEATSAADKSDPKTDPAAGKTAKPSKEPPKRRPDKTAPEVASANRPEAPEATPRPPFPTDIPFGKLDTDIETPIHVVPGGMLQLVNIWLTADFPREGGDEASDSKKTAASPPAEKNFLTDVLNNKADPKSDSKTEAKADGEKKEPEPEKPADGKFVVFLIALRNRHPEKRIDYHSFNGGGENTQAQLVDEQDRPFELVSYEAAPNPKRLKAVSIEPGEEEMDMIVFRAPDDNFKELHLALPNMAFGRIRGFQGFKFARELVSEGKIIMPTRRPPVVKMTHEELTNPEAGRNLAGEIAGDLMPEDKPAKGPPKSPPKANSTETPDKPPATKPPASAPKTAPKTAPKPAPTKDAAKDTKK